MDRGGLLVLAGDAPDDEGRVVPVPAHKILDLPESERPPFPGLIESVPRGAGADGGFLPDEKAEFVADVEGGGEQGFCVAANKVEPLGVEAGEFGPESASLVGDGEAVVVEGGIKDSADIAGLAVEQDPAGRSVDGSETETGAHRVDGFAAVPDLDFELIEPGVGERPGGDAVASRLEGDSKVGGVRGEAGGLFGEDPLFVTQDAGDEFDGSPAGLTSDEMATDGERRRIEGGPESHIMEMDGVAGLEADGPPDSADFALVSLVAAENTRRDLGVSRGPAGEIGDADGEKIAAGGIDAVADVEFEWGVPAGVGASLLAVDPGVADGIHGLEAEKGPTIPESGGEGEAFPVPADGLSGMKDGLPRSRHRDTGGGQVGPAEPLLAETPAVGIEGEAKLSVEPEYGTDRKLFQKLPVPPGWCGDTL